MPDTTRIVMEDTPNVAWQDFPEPDVHALVIPFVGCHHGCVGCHTPQLQDRKGNGVDLTVKEVLSLIEIDSKRCNANCVVLQGGEPLMYYRAAFVRDLLSRGTFRGFRFCVYTGLSLEDAQYMLDEAPFAYLKCGKYMADQKQTPGKTDEWFILASKNQVLYDSHYYPLSTDGVYVFKGGKCSSN